MAQFMVIRLTPKPKTIHQSRPECPVSRGRATRSKITADVMSRSQTIAVGGTKSNRSLAIAAPTWTEMIPDSTSQTGGSGLSRAPRHSARW